MAKVGEEKLGCFVLKTTKAMDFSFSSVSIVKPCLYLQYVDINFSPGISHSKGPFKKVHTLGWGRTGSLQTEQKRTFGWGWGITQTNVCSKKQSFHPP